jgi:hypothetical protein
VARLKKDVLRPGSYSVTNKDGTRRVVGYTDADIRHLHARFQAFKLAGIHVPVCWEHQDSALPSTPEEISRRIADRARLHLGFVEDTCLDGDTLSHVLDVSDDEDARQAERVRFASPMIATDWTDGTGRLWPGKSIVHVAVTPRPVRHDQKPFERMSMVCLSLSDRLGDTSVAEEKPDKKESEGGEDGGEGGAPAQMKDLIEALRGAGLTIPDEVADLDGLIIAVKASSGSGEGTDESPPADAVPAPPPDSSPAMMGLARQVEGLSKRLLEAEKTRLSDEINKLHDTARITRPRRDILAKKLNVTKLSMGEDGQPVRTELHTIIEAYQALDTGSAGPVALGHGDVPTPVERPSGTGTGNTDEDDIQAALEMVGLRKPRQVVNSR